jgi:hypothetical protein
MLDKLIHTGMTLQLAHKFVRERRSEQISRQGEAEQHYSLASHTLGLF